MTETVDAVVVGAGVVGLAIARALALDGRELRVEEFKRPGRRPGRRAARPCT